MDQAFLLWAINRVVRSVKIRNQYSLKSIKQAHDQLAFPGRAVHKDNIFQCCKCPDISRTSLEVNSRFICMYESPSRDFVNEHFICLLIVGGRACLKVIYVSGAKLEPKNLI